MHGDVFRAPKNPNLLSVLVGSGVQLLAMVIITLCACTLSLLPSRPLTACAGHRFRGPRVLVPCQPRGADDRYAPTVRLHGVRASSCACRDIHFRLTVFASRVFAGNVSSRLYKSFNGLAWKRNTIMVRPEYPPHLVSRRDELTRAAQTAVLFPGVVFMVFFLLNFFVWGKGSSGAVPFGTLFALLFLWFGISVPLCFVGSYFGFRKKVGPRCPDASVRV